MLPVQAGFEPSNLRLGGSCPTTALRPRPSQTQPNVKIFCKIIPVRKRKCWNNYKKLNEFGFKNFAGKKT
jgi:hypothetical protein